MNTPISQSNGNTRLKICWALFAIWLPSLLWSSFSPASTSGMAAAGIQFLALMIFVVLHSSLEGGWRGAVAFIAVLFGTSFLLESLSIATGFPFGFFEHHSPGPRAFGVPVVVSIGYAVYGWLAWSQTLTILRAAPGTSRSLALCAGPLIGTMVLVGYDYPWDAIGATVLNIHSYRDPSGLFGVPLSNFFGWILTGWVAFQIYALIQHRFRATAVATTRGSSLLPPLIYIGMAAGYFLRMASADGGTVSVAGSTFNVKDIYEASAAISLPALVFPALIATFAALARAPSRT